jgi:hypothetical protein
LFPHRSDGSRFAIIYDTVSPRIRTSIRIAISYVALAIALSSAFGQAAAVVDDGPSPIVVVGFVGGFVNHDATVHTVVQLADHLRHQFPSGVSVGIFENRHREEALARILHLLDVNHDGTISPDEKRNARIILYGHSWGASETVTLARQLQKENIPVRLTVQVDSVSKVSENDRVIPANVAEAANFYQLNGFVHGHEISAADPAHTHILGNFRFDYRANQISCPQYPWYDRIFLKSHTEIECDPKVWNQVESLIKSKLPADTIAKGN